jgi:ATP-dependent helicase HrpB
LSRFSLPVEECLDNLKRHLCERDEVILQAPPGAGKTTLVPLALLGESWLANKKILMLEPRRIATKTAAMRMSSLLNETPGQTVGYRMRLESKVSSRTRIEIITEGVLTRMLQRDPSLEDVGLVIFDEFHERNLDSDLALARALPQRSYLVPQPGRCGQYQPENSRDVGHAG